MSSTDLCIGADPITFSLNVECQEGDFYMAKDSKMFFIIKEKAIMTTFRINVSM